MNIRKKHKFFKRNQNMIRKTQTKKDVDTQSSALHILIMENVINNTPIMKNNFLTSF